MNLLVSIQVPGESHLIGTESISGPVSGHGEGDRETQSKNSPILPLCSVHCGEEMRGKEVRKLSEKGTLWEPS